MRMPISGLLLIAVLVGGPVWAGDLGVDAITLADLSEKKGRVLSIDSADLVFLEKGAGESRLLPLAEVREIRWSTGEVENFLIVDDPLGGKMDSPSSLRASGRFRRDDLELSRGEVTYYAFGKGVMAGALATFFTSDGDEKKLAFGLGFLAHFSLSLYMGW